MNTAELEILQSKTLSHLSRSLYAFFLRPNAEKNILKLDTMAAAYYLSSSSSCFPTQASLDTVLKCLDELSAHKLVSYTQDAATGEYLFFMDSDDATEYIKSQCNEVYAPLAKSMGF